MPFVRINELIDIRAPNLGCIYAEDECGDVINYGMSIRHLV